VKKMAVKQEVSVKGTVVRSNDSRVVDGITVQRITVDCGRTKTLCLLSGEHTDKVQAGNQVELKGTPGKFNAANREFGKYVQVTSLRKVE